MYCTCLFDLQWGHANCKVWWTQLSHLFLSVGSGWAFNHENKRKMQVSSPSQAILTLYVKWNSKLFSNLIMVSHVCVEVIWPVFMFLMPVNVVWDAINLLQGSIWPNGIDVNFKKYPCLQNHELFQYYLYYT